MDSDRIRWARLAAVRWRLVGLAILATSILTFVTISLIIATCATTMAIRTGGDIDPNAMETIATITGDVGGRWFSVAFVSIASYAAARRAGRDRALHGALVGIGSASIGAGLDFTLGGAMPWSELPWVVLPVLCGIGGGAAAKSTAARALRTQRAIRGIERARTNEQLVAAIGTAFESEGVALVALLETRTPASTTGRSNGHAWAGASTPPASSGDSWRAAATWQARPRAAAGSSRSNIPPDVMPMWERTPTPGTVSRARIRPRTGPARRAQEDLGWESTLVLSLDTSKRLVLALRRVTHRSMFGFGGFERVVATHRRRLRALASQLRLAIEKIRLLERARSAAVHDERRRLAHGFHDTLAQGFASIVLHLEAAEPALDGNAKRARDHLVQARTTARESLVRAREIVWGLRPDTEDRLPLPVAVRENTERFAREAAIDTHFDVTGDPRRLRPEIEAAVLRSAQEALANCRKHARASRVGVTLTYLDDVLRLDVRDDGTGFDPAALHAAPRSDTFGVDSYGLESLRQTIAHVGGRLDIESAPGDGTTMVVEVPARPFESTAPAPPAEGSQG